jgi:hypothetical protein
MPDNPAMRLAHRAAALAGRRAAESAGARPTAVSVVVETYSGTTGLAGTTLVSTSTLVLSPRPKVSTVREGSGYFGGGPGAASSGRLVAGVYTIGPITLTAPGGGYSVAQVAPPSGASKAVYYLLAGDDFASGGERFDLLEVDASRPHQVTLTVQRTAQ